MMLVDFGCGTEASNILFIDFLVAFIEPSLWCSRICCCLKRSHQFGVKFFYYSFIVVCDVFVDLGVSEVLVDALLDVSIHSIMTMPMFLTFCAWIVVEGKILKSDLGS